MGTKHEETDDSLVPGENRQLTKKEGVNMYVISIGFIVMMAIVCALYFGSAM